MGPIHKNINIVRILAKVFLLVGILGWFSSFLSRPFRPYAELPNSTPHGIATDKKGNIYCGSKFYGRIQKYHPDGRFVCGFDTDGGTERGSDFDFNINEKNQLCVNVCISKDNKGSVHHLKVYDEKCKLIKEEKSKADKRDYIHDMKSSVIDMAGNRYTFKGFLFPRVIKQTPNGNKSIIISTPIWLWFFQGPFPSFAFCFVSMFILIFIQARSVKLNSPAALLVIGILSAMICAASF